MSYLMPHQRCNHWLSGRWCAAGAQVEKGTPESCWGDVLLNPFTSQSGNRLLGEQDKSRSLPPLPGCRADPPSSPFISTCICTDALQVQEDACLAWLTLRCPLFQGQPYAVCLVGSNCLRWGRLVGAGEEGAHLSVGFRENKCKREVPLLLAGGKLLCGVMWVCLRYLWGTGLLQSSGPYGCFAVAPGVLQVCRKETGQKHFSALKPFCDPTNGERF